MNAPSGFIRIDRQFWRSKAVENLSTHAKLLLIELQYRHNGSNNGNLSMSFIEASARLRCSKSTVVRSFAELHQAGLIEITVRGSFDLKNGSRKGTANQYRLTFLQG